MGFLVKNSLDTVFVLAGDGDGLTANGNDVRGGKRGIGALVVGVFWTILGWLQIVDFLSGHDDVASYIIAGGIKVSLIPVLYGLIVYFVSLIIRVIRKPRI